MERKSMDRAKKKMKAATGRAFFEKENMLMEREVNDVRKGKAKKGMRKNGAAQKTELSVDQAKKEIVDKGKSEEEDSRAKKGKGIKGNAEIMKLMMERAKKKIAEKGRPKWETVDHSTYQTCQICVSTDHWTNCCPKTYALRPGDFVGPWGQIVCLCCGKEMPHPGVPAVDWPARALKRPIHGGVYPSIEQQRKELNL